MEHLNPVDQARQLAAEVVKRLGQLNLHRRELERKLHVANGFFTSLEEKNNMTLLLFFEVKAVIEEHYERRIEFYRYVNPPLSREAERELGVEGKSEGDNGDALSKFFNEKFLSEEK